MKILFKNILAVFIGIIVGSMVNMAIIMLSHFIIAPPLGTDVSTMEGLKAALPLFGPQHFIMPFVAHALGTFCGAYMAALLAVRHKIYYAFAIGVFFLIGGILNVFMLPAPLWFISLDLAGAYLPLGYLGGKLAALKK